MLADLRFALRTLAKAPGFVAVAVLVAALGIGANTAIFSVVRAVILRTLPMHDPNQVVMIWERNPQLKDFLSERFPVPLEDFLEWKRSATFATAMSVFTPDSVTLTGAGKPEDVKIVRAAYDLPQLFGVTPRVGRMYTADEERVAILSDAFFQRVFHGDASRLGSTLELNGENYTAIGVWPKDFHLPAMWQGFEETEGSLWLPMNLHPTADRPGGGNNFVYARLRPGVSIAQARAEMEAIWERMRKTSQAKAGFGVNVFPVAEEDLSSGTRRYVLLLQGAVGLVLLIGCANIANLLLTRAIGRRKEMAVRIALGATRWALVRQCMAESLLLSLAGGAAGLLVARWAISGLSAIAPSDTAHLHDFTLDPVCVLFALAVTIVSGIVFGLAPSFDAARRNLGDALNQGGRSGSGGISRRLRGALVAGGPDGGSGFVDSHDSRTRRRRPGISPRRIADHALEPAGRALSQGRAARYLQSRVARKSSRRSRRNFGEHRRRASSAKSQLHGLQHQRSGKGAQNAHLGSDRRRKLFSNDDDPAAARADVHARRGAKAKTGRDRREPILRAPGFPECGCGGKKRVSWSATRTDHWRGRRCRAIGPRYADRSGSLHAIANLPATDAGGARGFERDDGVVGRSLVAR
jgi:putative ABC transport system permease protein